MRRNARWVVLLAGAGADGLPLMGFMVATGMALRRSQ